MGRPGLSQVTSAAKVICLVFQFSKSHRQRENLMDTNATTDDDVNAIKKLADEFFAGVNTGDLARRMSTM